MRWGFMVYHYPDLVFTLACIALVGGCLAILDDQSPSKNSICILPANIVLPGPAP